MSRRISLNFNLGGVRLRTTLLSILSSLVLLIGSIVVWNYVKNTVDSQRSVGFEDLVNQQSNYFKEVSLSVVNYLYDLRGHLTFGKMEPGDWKSYIFASSLEQRYPGQFSFSYEEIVKKDELNNFIDKLKLSDTDRTYSSYVVFPKTDNADLYPIKYLYTFDKDISLFLGYDLGSSEVQVSAIREAVLNGSPSMTTLFNVSSVVQNSTESYYVITMPVYSNSGALELTPAERQKFLVGFVNAWIKPKNLFSPMAGADQLAEKDLTYTIKEGNSEIYSYQDNLGKGNLSSQREINILGRSFEVDFSNVKPYVLSPLVESLPFNALIILILTNALWDITLVAMILAKSKAQRMADAATKDLMKFRQAVDGVSDLVIITNPKGQILYANNAAKKITGYSKAEIIGNTPRLWGGLMDKDFYDNFWKTLTVDKKVFVGELRNKRKSGESYDVELSVWPILDEKKDLIYLVGIERDISKTKAVERMKTEFISLASHQLRTPLSAVKWFGKMLADGEAGPLSKTQADYLSKINESNEREIQLINSLLNVSRIESGKIKVLPVLTDIKALVESVIGDIKIGLDKEKRKITYEIPNDLPKIEVDPDLIRHVYSNLLMNAVKYSDTNDSIKLEISVKGDELLTKISDTGIGISSEEKERIFEKFFRGTNALKKETDGSGLGLYLAKSIIESSGGKMWFDSKENVGTTFWFTIPLSGMKKTTGRTSLS